MKILSMNDVVLNAKAPNEELVDGIQYVDIMKTYQAICEHPEEVRSAASA